MALQSKLFRGDSKLEATATSDSAHILPGSAGDHVRKIQVALIRLEGAAIKPDGVYGRATADAVLKYKQKRGIINRNYQTSEDNIVGRMTMTSLDVEMLAEELNPVFLQPLHPISRTAISRYRGPSLAFSISGSSLFGIGGLTPVPVPPAPNPGPNVLQEEVIIARGAIGTFKVLGGKGGSVVRSQIMRFYGQGRNRTQVAELTGAITPGRDFEELAVLSEDLTVTYRALNCGETFFQARVSPPHPPQKLSTIVRLLCLADVTTALSVPSGDYSPEPNLKTGLLSKEGTPLNPLPGRKINIFGKGESAGFEDYSSDIDFCTQTFSNGNGPTGASLGHRPWTADPRRGPGLGEKTINNICCRGSPIEPTTIKEILRIGANKCRVTYAQARGRDQCDLLRAGLPGGKLLDEGTWGSGATGRAIVVELG